jgi:ABC-2 type transport system permease protein
MAPALEAVSTMLPMTYAYDALARAVSPAPLGSEVARDVVVIVAVTLFGLAMGALTLRRRTP